MQGSADAEQLEMLRVRLCLVQHVHAQAHKLDEWGVQWFGIESAFSLRECVVHRLCTHRHGCTRYTGDTPTAFQLIHNTAYVSRVFSLYLQM